MKLSDIINNVVTPSFEAAQPRYFLARCPQGHVYVDREPRNDYRCVVCTFGGYPHAPYDEYPCKHCSEFSRDHALLDPSPVYWRRAPQFACLFSPTKFEPMTQQELEARYRRE